MVSGRGFGDSEVTVDRSRARSGTLGRRHGEIGERLMVMKETEEKGGK